MIIVLGSVSVLRYDAMLLSGSATKTLHFSEIIVSISPFPPPIISVMSVSLHSRLLRHFSSHFGSIKNDASVVSPPMYILFFYSYI